jgi:ATP-dependent Clp protease protease subunit
VRIKNRSIFKPRARIGHKIENKADEATLYLYDEISWWGIDPQVFVKDLNEITAKTIHLRVNSPGGSVFDGLAIHNALKQHESKVIAHIDGLAASIASVIVLAADEVRAAESSYLMIHEPWSMVAGTATEMREEADLLDKVGGTISQVYQKKTGLDAEEIAEMMSAGAFGETWLTAEEAKEKGFVDVVEELEEETKAKASAVVFDLSAFANVPDGLMAERRPPTERETERILRDAGYSAKQAKEILAKGYAEGLRDVDPAVDAPSADVQAQRDVEQPEAAKKDRVTELLIEAERVKSLTMAETETATQ